MATEKPVIRFLRRTLPRYRRNIFGQFLLKAATTAARFIENDNYSIEENGELRVMQCLKASGLAGPIFDVGGNIGEYSVLARKHFPQTEIYAFEPVKETYTILCRNTEGLNIQTFNFGLGDKEETLEFTVCPGNLGVSTAHGAISRALNSGSNFLREDCRIRAAAAVASERGVQEIGFLKIDTEGHDWHVLHGFETLLRAGKIKIIQFEYGAACIVTKKLLFDFYDLLIPHGYRVGKIYPTFVDFREYHTGQEDFIGPNFLAVHRSFDSAIFE